MSANRKCRSPPPGRRMCRPHQRSTNGWISHTQNGLPEHSLTVIFH